LLFQTAESSIGYKSSIIDYSNKIENLFAKMEGVRTEVLPPNRGPIDDYFNNVWDPVHTLTAAVLQLQPGPDFAERFKSYLEAEEARLGDNLKAVEYVIDGTDTLALITGMGRIEKVSTSNTLSPTFNSSEYYRLSFHCCTC
jgi:hypothetical protein